MDISSALESCIKTTQTLKKFPSWKRLPKDNIVYTTSKRVSEINGTLLEGCREYLVNMASNIESELAVYTYAYFDNIKAREDFINRRFAESNDEIRSQAEKMAIISEIEELEKRNIGIIKFNDSESKDLIKNIHENNSETFSNKSFESVIRENTRISFDESDNVKVEALKKILEYCKSPTNYFI